MEAGAKAAVDGGELMDQRMKEMDRAPSVYADLWRANPIAPPQPVFATLPVAVYGRPMTVYPPGPCRHARQEIIVSLGRQGIWYNPYQYPLLEALCEIEAK